MSSAPGWMVRMAARRRRPWLRRQATNWITDASAPIPAAGDDPVEQWAERLNQPLHDALRRRWGGPGVTVDVVGDDGS